jgi:arylsulfatase A-like enzyme/cytochrome c-type biogenesis protein CcmH/NrfG
LITIDTLRADYLGCNGSPHAPTPNLDRIATEGVNFTRARASVPLTLPSHASILTANQPPTHTVRDNGGFRLPDEQISLAEVLEKQGFRSIAVVSSFVLDHRYGLNQGFEVYDDRVWSDLSEIENLATERSGDQVFQSFRSWLRVVEAEQRFFAWVHLYDPHAPHEPPEPFRSRYRDNPYAGEVAYVDEIVGKLLGELSSSDRLDRTVVAVVGDHGEGLGDHGESTHSLLIHNSTLHVPMMIRAPGLIPPKTVVGQLVRTIDLAPTLIDLLGLEVDIGEGVSLKPLLGNASEARELEALTSYSESLYGQINLGWAPLFGLETSDYRLILGPSPELFKISEDPGETKNLIDAEPEVFQELRDRLSQIEQLPESRDADPKQKLSVWNQIQVGIALYGQNDFSAAARTFEEVLRDDPEVLLAYEFLGASLEKGGEFEKAQRNYEAALSSGIDSAQIRVGLGKIHLSRGNPSAAVAQLERAIEIDPRSTEAHYYLGNAYRAAKKTDLAVAQYRAAVALNPSYVWAWNGLGMTLAEQGADSEALRAFRRAVDTDPGAALGYFNLAVHLERMGSTQQTIDAYRRFLDLSDGQELDRERALALQALERLDS